ncbi:MAG: glycosyltransferase family 4 protein [Deferrisomatales bacterium]|nr:glycosyltransferase family 4 protein [Deferrisomatales bacterium]
MSKYLRVLHLAHVRWFNAEAQYALDLAGEMARQGHQVSFLAQEASPAAGKSREAGLETVEEAGFNDKGLRALAALPAALRLLRLLRSRPFDAALVHRPEGLPLVAWACRRAGVPCVRVRGDMRPLRADPLNRALYTRWLAGVVASNEAIARSLKERLGPIPRLRTIHGGVDPTVFTPEGTAPDLRRELGLGEETFLVGILGRLGRVKGHDDFLEGARVALRAGAEAAFVVLVKEATPRRAELEARVAADPVLTGRVVFLGHRVDLPGVLRSFDLGVVASTGSEANCRVGLEWMASGVPLVATRVGVLPDLVEEGESGFLIPPGDPSSLGEKVVYLAGCPDEAGRLGRVARRRVLEQFSLDRCARAHASFLYEICRDLRP